MRSSCIVRAPYTVTNLFNSEVPVELLQGDEALCEIFVIHLLVKNTDLLFTQ